MRLFFPRESVTAISGNPYAASGDTLTIVRFDLGGVTERLRRYDPAEPRALSWFVGALRDASGCDTVAAWSYAFVDDRLTIDSFEASGSPYPRDQVVKTLDSWVAANRRAPSSFDVQRPEPWQRGRILTTPSPSKMLRVGAPPQYRGRLVVPDERVIATCIAPTGGDRPTCRVLVCDRSSLLAYVAMFHEEAVRERQRRPLRALLGALTARLRLEHRLENAELYRHGLDAAIEYLPAAAFVVSRRGVVVAANQIGRAWLERDRAVIGLLTSRTGPDRRVFEVTPLRADATTNFLAIRRDLGTDPDRRLALKARTWRLTPRETQVTGWILRAASNRSIADELGCAEGTVEIHVSRILRKSGAENRSELVVKILS